MPANVITDVFGVLVFLYIFWKRLKEDYAASIIFSVSFYILLGIMLGWIVAIRFFPSWFFWASGVGAVTGLGLGMLRFKVKFYESLESLGVGILPWLSFLFLKDSVVSSSLISFLAFLAILLLVYLFYYLDTHYREFTWYVSGKVGFAGLATLGLFFLLRTGAFLAGFSVVSFASKYEPFISGSMAFICFILLYNLSRSKV